MLANKRKLRRCWLYRGGGDKDMSGRTADEICKIVKQARQETNSSYRYSQGLGWMGSIFRYQLNGHSALGLEPWSGGLIGSVKGKYKKSTWIQYYINNQTSKKKVPRSESKGGTARCTLHQKVVSLVGIKSVWSTERMNESMLLTTDWLTTGYFSFLLLLWIN